MASVASSPHITMALQSSKGQQKSLVLWTWWQLSVACRLFFISKNLDAFSRAVGRGSSSRTVLCTMLVFGQVGVQLREGPTRGKIKNPLSQSSTTSLIPLAKVVWQCAIPFLGLSVLKDLKTYCLCSTVMASGHWWLRASFLAWCVWPPRWHGTGPAQWPCSGSTSTGSCAASVLVKLFGSRILCRFCCSSSSCVVCFWKQYVLLDTVLFSIQSSHICQFVYRTSISFKLCFFSVKPAHLSSAFWNCILKLIWKSRQKDYSLFTCSLSFTWWWIIC